MDITRWELIIDKLRPYIHALRITGGEATLHSEFPALMKRIDELGVPFVLFTNGNWVKADQTIEILTNCKSLRGLLVSLHGSNPTAFRQFTGIDSFSKVVTNIRSATAAGLRVATNTLLLSNTIPHLSEVVDVAFSSGATNVSFGRYYGPPLKDFSITTQELRWALSQIAAMRRSEPRISLSNCVPTCFSPEEDFGGGGCTSGFTHCTIGPWGEVRPCTHSEVVLGHMPEGDIETMWQSSVISQWRNLIPEDCLSCAALNACRGGCRAVAQRLSLSRDPLHRRALKKTISRMSVELGMSDRPKLSFPISKKETSFGISLSGAGHYITLSHASKPILDRLDGNTTLESIFDEFGPASLDLIAGLLHQQLLEMM